MTDSNLRSGPAEVAHGQDCVSLVPDGHHPGAAVLTPDDADQLAVPLVRQAAFARSAERADGIASMYRDRADGPRCPRCGTNTELSRWGVCQACAVAEGWETQQLTIPPTSQPNPD